MTRRAITRRVSRRRRAEPRDDGAAAVEFALVLPILVLILFGIVDYGLYFSDSFSARSGVSTAAREGSVAAFDANACDGETLTLDPASPPPSADVRDIMCAVAADTDTLTGHVYVAVVVPSGGWAVGSELTVCEMVDVDGITGYTPLPHGGDVRVKNAVAIEQPALDPVTGDPTVETSGYESLPHGDWSWCSASA